MERISDLLLLKSLAEEVRDQTLSRSRYHEADRAVEAVDRSLAAAFARSTARANLASIDHKSPENWLQPYIEAVIARGLCVRITCGTCGSMPFKDGFVMLASDGRRGIGNVDIETMRTVAAALVLVEPAAHNRDQLQDFERAAMSIIYFIWSRSPGFDRWAPQLLSGSWAGTILDRMRRHYGGRRRTP